MAEGQTGAPLVGLEGNLANQLAPFNNGVTANGYQLFSFYKGYGANYKEIHVFPNSVYQHIHEEFGYNSLNKNNTPLTNAEEIMKGLPQIQIREYAQDSKIMQIYNVFKYFVKGMKSASKVDKDKETTGTIREFFNKFLENFKNLAADSMAWNKANEHVTNPKLTEAQSVVIDKLKQIKTEINNIEAEINDCQRKIQECDEIIKQSKTNMDNQIKYINDRYQFLSNEESKRELTEDEYNELNILPGKQQEYETFYNGQIEKLERIKQSFFEKIKSLEIEKQQKEEDIKQISSQNMAPINSAAANMQRIRGFAFEIPFLLYYQMCTTKTNAVYVLPYSGKIVDQSSGGGFESRGLMKFQTSQFGVLGTLLNFFTKNIRFNTTPVWGTDQQEQFPAIEVDVDLFNDTPEAAANNFVFVNSIMAKNRFIQYHIMQHNPCVYDIKIDGYNRLYMCQANITCNYKGVSRVPSDAVIKEIVSQKNPYLGETFNKNIKAKKLISIPDVYNIKITFQSLLPNSFNNYLFRFSGNSNMSEIVNETMFDGQSYIQKIIQDAYKQAKDQTSGFDAIESSVG